jgi:hypothetical protein
MGEDGFVLGVFEVGGWGSKWGETEVVVYNVRYGKQRRRIGSESRHYTGH